MTYQMRTTTYTIISTSEKTKNALFLSINSVPALYCLPSFLTFKLLLDDRTRKQYYMLNLMYWIILLSLSSSYQITNDSTSNSSNNYNRKYYIHPSIIVIIWLLSFLLVTFIASPSHNTVASSYLIRVEKA